MASARKLLEKRSYREITVLDIVADSGVNRNTFYYHFRDMAALVEELACRRIDKSFDKPELRVDEKLSELVHSLYENRRTVMHVYASADREIFDKGLDNICEHIISRVFEDCPLAQNKNDDECARIFLLCKSCMYGIVSGALLRGLPENEKGLLLNLCIDPRTYIA